MVLHAAEFQVRDVVAAGVVALHATDEGKVHGRPIQERELRQIRIVGETPIDRGADGRRARIRCIAQDTRHVEVAAAGFEHQRRPAHATGLEVEDHTGVLRPRMFTNEGGGTEEAGFLRVGDQEDDIVRGRRTRAQRAHGLEHRSRPGGVIARGRSSWDAVVVGHQQDGESARLRPGHTHQDVPHMTCHGIPRADSSGALDLRRQAQFADFADDVGEHRRMCLTAGRMRALRDAPNVGECPFSGELGGRRRRGYHWRRAFRVGHRQLAKDENHRDPQQLHHWV